MMTQYYARIKSFKGKLVDYLTAGKWYGVLGFNLSGVGRINGRGFSFINDYGIKNARDEFNSFCLNDGDWEIVEGNEIEYKYDGLFCPTLCPFGTQNGVGSDGCRLCTHFIVNNRSNKTVTCVYPQNKEKTMKFKEAWEHAEFGEKIKYGICSSYVIKTDDKFQRVVWDNSGYITFDELFNVDEWYVESRKVPITIGGESFEISKESAKSFKESINKVKL